MSTCPAGHDSTATDYCDVCGLAIVEGGAAAGTPAAAPTAGAPGNACPNCDAGNPPNALFCEACGYDFTTGSLPRPIDPPSSPATSTSPSVPAQDAPSAPASSANPSPAPKDSWVAEIWIDPDWYADQASTDPMPSPGLPIVTPLRNTSVLIGRSSRSRGIDPDIDLSSDNGISRRHAQLSTDGTRWFVEDLGSSNGTYVGSASGALPTTAVPQGQRAQITDDDRVYLGAWTRIVVRRASPGEV